MQTKVIMLGACVCVIMPFMYSMERVDKVMERLLKAEATAPGIAKRVTQYVKPATLGDTARDLQAGRMHFKDNASSQLQALTQLVVFFKRDFDIIRADHDGIKHAAIVLSRLREAGVVIPPDTAQVIDAFFCRYNATNMQEAYAQFEARRSACEEVKALLLYVNAPKRSESPLGKYADTAAFLQRSQQETTKQ